jgi:DNA-binding MarR family transcriptional regulator
MSMKSNGSVLNILSLKNRRLASALYRWEGLLQKHFHDNVEAQSVMYFLHIASQVEPIDLTSIGNALGISKAASTRNFYRLSVGIRGGTEGLDLVQFHDDPMDIRRKLLTLTPKGISVARELTSFIAEQVDTINQNASVV